MAIDLSELFKNLQQVQAQMGDIQQKLLNITASGSAGGDLVEVEMNGNFEVLNVKINPVAVDPRDVPMLEELVQSALVSATMKIREKIKEEMSGTLGGLPFPGGFPFQ